MKDFLSILMALFGALLFAEGSTAQHCFNTVDVQLPLAKRSLGLAPAEAAYLVEDEFTFWYRIGINSSIEMNFYVMPLNSKDSYECLAYRYAGTDLCQKLLKDAPRIYGERHRHGQYERHTYQLEQDSTYYLSVLSMSPEDCGHQLVLWTGTDTLRIKAVHRVCEEDVEDLADANGVELDTLAADIHDINDMPLEDPSLADLAAMAGLSFVGPAGEHRDELEIGDKAILQNIHFYPNTYAFKETARPDLEKLFEFMQKAPMVSVEIQGHTASNARVKYVDERYQGLGEEYTFVGTAQELSEKRAKAVMGYLQYRGVDSKRLSTEGFGASEKLHDVKFGHDDFGKNMRVEIVITAIHKELE